MTELPQTAEPDLPQVKGDSEFLWVHPSEIPWRLMEGWQFCSYVIGADCHHGYWSAAMWKKA